MIPSIASRKIQHPVDKALYALRNRIERFFNRVKNSRRVATRYDKLTESFAAFVLLASIRIWIKFVHAT
jgi:transposase